MSTTIDQRVVEMRFDNKQFESATRTSMSTLDKLKQKLNLTGASKGLEEINHAAKNNSLPTLGNAAEAVSAKFSALQVMGVTALANITNSAVNAGKRLIAAFTVDPVKTGFQEYELKMGSIQTIMASTGESLQTVNKYLNELNTYSDKTIYSFSDMTNNIGKFTNAGVKLEDAVLAIKGISNEAAVSGATANEASRAMYNFSQALSAGYVKLIDWKSIENANMATVEFKQQLIETAVACGTLTKTSDGLYNTGKRNISATQNFNDSLTDQWMTTEVLTRTLANYATDVREMTDAEREAYHEKLKSQGYTEEQIKNIEELGKKAYDSAQDVKTFSMMMDTLKEAAQSGWAQTWELIFGNFEQGKNLWTSLSKFFGDIIDKSSKLRNTLLEGALGKSFTGLIDKVKGIIDPIKKSADSIKEVGESIKDYGKIVDEIIFGKWGNGKERFNALTEAGYDWAHAQNLVNEKLVSSVRHATDYSEAQKKVSESQEKTVNSTGKLTDAEKNRLIALASLDEEGLKNKNLTKEQIEALNELRETADKLGIPMDEFIKNLDEIDGRWILLNSFKNIGQSLVTVFRSLGQAWRDIFPPVTSDQLFNIIAGFHKLTTYLKISDETVDKLTRTFKGLFAILDIVLTLTAGPLKIAFKALTSLLKVFDYDILSFAADLGDAIVSFRDWIDEVVNFDAIFEYLAPMIESAAKAVRGWVDANIDLSAWLQKITDYLGPAKEAISGWIEGLKNTDDIHQYIIDTIINAIKKVKEYLSTAFDDLGETMSKGMNNALEAMLVGWQSIPSDIAEGFNEGFLVGIASIIKNVKTFCTKFITSVKDLFEIHSPSQVMFEIGQFVIQGFIDGVVGMYDAVISAVKNLFTGARDSIVEVDFSKPLDGIVDGVKKFGSKIAEVFSGIDLGKIFAAVLGVGMLAVAKKAIDVLEMFGKPLEGVGEMLEGIGEMFEGFGKNLKANAMLKKAKALLIISSAVMILVMAILPLTELSWEQLGKAGASLLALAAVIVGISLLMGKIGSVDTGSLGSMAKLLVVAGSLFLLAFAVKKLSEIAIDGTVKDTIIMLAATVGSLAAVMFAFGAFVNADKSANIDKAGMMIFKMAAALLTLTTVIKIVSGFTYSDITKGLTFILGVGILFTLVIAVSKLAGEHADKAGTMMLKMSIAMLLMAGVVKIASGFSDEEIKRGIMFVSGVELLFAGLIAISHLSGENAKKAGKMISSMGIAMLAMVLAVKIVAGMDESDIKKGLGVVSALMILFAGVVAVSHFAGEHAMKAGIMLLAMSVALGLMVAITFIVSKLEPKEMWKALGFITVLELMFAGLMALTKYTEATKEVKGLLIWLIVATGLMVAALIGLSFIDPKDLATATGALAGVMGMFATLMVATKYTKNTKHMRKSLLALLGVTSVLAGIIVALSKLDPDSALKSAGSLSMLLLAFSSSIFILGKAGRVSKTAIAALQPMLQIAGGLAIIVAAFAVLNKFGMESSIQSAATLGILLNAFATSIVVLSKAGSVSKSAMSALYPMLAVSAGLAGILAVFGILNKFGMEPSIQSAAALGILLNAFTASIVILGKTGSISKSAMAALYPMLAVAAGLGGILAIFGVLSKYGMEPSIQTAVALGILLNAFSASILVLSLAGPVSKSALSALQPMVLVTAELAVILGLLSALDVQASIPSAIALGILLNALAASVVILSFAGPSATAAIPAAISMGLVIMELALAIGIMASMNVDSAIPYAVSLGILLTALTVGIGILGLIAPLIPAAIPAVIGLGVVVAELALLLAAIGGLAQIPGLEWLISEGGEFLKTIGTALGQFIGGIVGGIAEGITSMLPEIANNLSAFMTNIQPFITGAQSINETVLTGVGYLSGAILLLTAADLLAGIASLAGMSFVDLGTQLSGFIMAAMPFISNIQMIDPASVEAAKTLAEMIIILTAAELLSGITSFIGGSTDFSTFGTQLQSFGSAICAFSNTLTQNGGINEEAVTAAANAGKLIAGLQNELYGAGGIKQDIFGEKDLSVFGVQLQAFGTAICAFSNTLTQNGGIDSEAVESAVKAGELIAGLQNALYGAGGLKQDIFGDKDLSLFGIQLRAFGSAICSFSNTLKTNGGIDAEAVESAAKAGETMAALQNSLEAAGGLKQDIFGEKDLADFGAKIKAFGQAMVDFSSVVSGNISEDAVMAASNAGRVMAEVQAAIPEDKWFDGKMSLDDFGKKIAKFGESIVDYSNEVIDVDQEAVSKSITSANRLANLAKGIVELDTSGIETFKDVKSIGSTLKSYSENIAEINSDAISSSITNTRKLINLIASMAGLDTSGVSAFKSAISNLATTDLSGFTVAFTDVSKFTTVGSNIINAIKGGMMSNSTSLTTAGKTIVTNLVSGMNTSAVTATMAMSRILTNITQAITAKKEAFKNQGSALMESLISGVSGKNNSLKTTVQTSISVAVSGIRDYYDNFYNAGSYLVSGFANGISENTYKATAKAEAMAKAAAKAAEEALDINSPSKVFRAIGYSVPEGFAQGIDRLAYMAANSAVDMGNTAISAISKSIARISEAVNSDIDTQPTIRPVLDLSDVQSGASAISGLFNNPASIGVMANVGAISNSMNHRQNGVSNGDVVNAIDKLRHGLNNIGNTYYTIDGITYSNGDEVADAIQRLTRAVRVEGRI